MGEANVFSGEAFRPGAAWDKGSGPSVQTRKFTVEFLSGSEEITLFICLPAKTSTQICCKPLKGNGGFSPANQC